MGIIRSEISCTVEVPKGYVYFRYQSFEGRSPSLEFEASDEDLLCFGRTVGKRYYLDENLKLDSILNSEAMQSVRDSSKDLPDKLRDALGL